MRKLIIDSFIAIGGREIGVLDASGQQLHPQLAALAGLVPYMAVPVVGVGGAELERVERGVRERAVEAARLHVAVDGFVSVWDSCVEAMNGMLLAMDARMSKWEQQVDRIEKQRQIQPV